MKATRFLRAGPALLVAVTVLVTACSTPPPGTDSPAQSPNDSYAYRYLELDNSLPVLLISDPESPKAAASLDVMVGSGDNPAGRGGLAHFLEHMLFLGTEKYPDAAEYEEFITEHGGNRNAYTSFEHTNYFFDVDAPFLPEALDRFAQFFIAPQFDAQYIDREKNAVQAEYQMGLKSDGRRGLDVLQEVMNPEHPYSQFSVGSLETLADRPESPIRGELIAFYDKHYSANVMRLVVLGAEPLDELESMVRPMFSAVPNRDATPEQVDAPMFEQTQLPLLVKVLPEAAARQLQISFPMKDYRQAYKAKPLSYLGNLVGHEGKGSLLSGLKSAGLVEALSAASGIGWRGGSMFTISLTLTELGLAEYDSVLQMVFAYLDMLREQGPKDWLYEEQAILAELAFRFKEKADPINYVSALAAGMHVYDAQDSLQGPYLMEDYSEQLINEAVASLNAQNALITLTAPGVETDTESVHYKVPYSASKVAESQRILWNQGELEWAAHLPEPNPFLPQDVSLIPLEEQFSGEPEIVLETERQTLWFSQNSEFRVPRGASYINFQSALVGQTLEDNAAAALYTALLKDAVNEFTYPALLAGLNFNLYKHSRGISLRISGYTDKQHLLLEQLVEVMQASSFAEDRFLNIRADMVRALENSVAKRPSSQVLDDLREALLHGSWGEQAMIAALEAIDLASLNEYQRSFWDDARAEVLVYGNYPRDSVNVLEGTLASLLADTPRGPQPSIAVTRLDANESSQYAVEVPHSDAVVAWYLQGRENGWADRGATALTAQIMKSGFFQQLRTEQQLGYIVSAFAWPQMDVPGLVMLVQSPNASASEVAAAMQQFLEQLEGSLDEAQFARHQQALLNEILQPDKNLWERAEFYWQSIAKKQYQFEGRTQFANAVGELTLDTWLDYYRSVFMEHRHSLQTVSAGQKGELPEVQGKRYSNAKEVKQSHDTYVIE